MITEHIQKVQNSSQFLKEDKKVRKIEFYNFSAESTPKQKLEAPTQPKIFCIDFLRFCETRINYAIEATLLK